MATRIQKTEPAHSLLYQPNSLSNNVNPNVDEVLNFVDACLVNKFNDSQKLVFKGSFIDRVTLLWGPPGTGKTTVLAGIVLGWIENAQRQNSPLCIGIGSSNWTAIDNLLIEIAKLSERRQAQIGKLNLKVEVCGVR